MSDGVAALVNGRYLTRPPTGVDRFAIELLGALRRKLPIAVPRGTAVGATRNAVRTVGRRHGHAWEQFELPRAAGDGVLVNLCNTAPLLRQRQLVVIHDAAAVANASNYGWRFRSWYRLMHGSVMQRARAVVTVSRFSADELMRHYGRRGRPIEVVPEGGEHILALPADAAVVDRLGLRGRRYVLAVGSRSPNKNFAAVLQAVLALDDPDLLLVAVGGAAHIYAGAELRHARLRSAGYVSDAELRALYESAACFVFPSYYEGFGLPPLEAMCCGCPVIVSDRASLPEVCGSAALYCRAESPPTLARALRRLLASPALQAELRAAGFVRARHFGWQRASATFEQVLDAAFA